jgi:carbon-monoxide dehydrogenase small subunit
VKAAFEVNGRPVETEGEPLDRLLDVLRRGLGLTGSKEGCGEGECGACTVLLDGRPALSCLVPLCQVEGRRVVTVEGLAEDPAARPMLERLVSAGGVQCGACTPGIAVTAWALLQEDPAPGREAVREALAGNLCRCTGYEAILDALAGEENVNVNGFSEGGSEDQRSGGSGRAPEEAAGAAGEDGRGSRPPAGGSD